MHYVDPMEFLRRTHDRIRWVTREIGVLAGDPDPARPEAVRRAGECLAFLRDGLRLHEEDETESLRPRLVAIAPAAVRAVLGDLWTQHEQIVALSAAIQAELARFGTDEGPDLEALAGAQREFSSTMQTHLDLEERVVFPALEALSPHLRRVIAEEFAARREGDLERWL